MAFAAVYRTTTLKTSVLLLAISASLLCGLYLLRIQDLRIATDDYGPPPPGPFSAPPPEVVTNIEEVKGIKDVGAIEYVSASKEVTVPGSVFNRTLGVSSMVEDLRDRTWLMGIQFEKIFVISLPERSDRRDSIILSARLMNIEIEIIDAVRGENVLDKVIPSTDVGRFMKAEIGCWRSHMNVMQEFVFPVPPWSMILFDEHGWQND
jgi:Glycosyltransferase family 25 (LPS biosynthesis protein)